MPKLCFPTYHRLYLHNKITSDFSNITFYQFILGSLRDKIVCISQNFRLEVYDFKVTQNELKTLWASSNIIDE